MADIVLPATMFLEHDDFYTASGPRHVQVHKPIFEPFAECRAEPLRDRRAGAAAWAPSIRASP